MLKSRNVQGVNADGEEITSMYVEQVEDHSLHFDPDIPSLVRQEFAEEADVNVLMARYEKTGVLPAVSGQPQYLDLTAAPSDLLGAMLVLDEARAAFMRLPAHVRREFDNDPLQFVEFAQDPENVSQMRTWGLAEPEKAADAPMKVEVVNPPPADKEAPQAP